MTFWVVLSIGLFISIFAENNDDGICISQDTCTDNDNLDPITIEWFNDFNSHLNTFDTLSVGVFFENITITSSENRVPRKVPDSLFTRVDPTPILDPELVSISLDAFQDILNIKIPTNNNAKTQIYNILTRIISGDMDVLHKYLPNAVTYSHVYCGHQFGSFSGQLGDGRAIYIGEYMVNDKDRIELQLKGSGLTPFSRKGDGRAVLRSSIREYLVSEYMHYLGVPTTRAGIVIKSDKTKVNRDMYYNGNIKSESTSIVLRLAPSFIRFGSFEIGITKNGYFGPSYYKDKSKKEKTDQLLKSLLDYVIENYYDGVSYTKFWEELVERSVKLVVMWDCIGFVHGVLNTDNMSILGLGIDYGPYGFMEYYDEEYIPNYSDNEGRYAYGKQKEIFEWNLNILAETLHDANIIDIKITKTYLQGNFDVLCTKYYNEQMRKKFGVIQEINAFKVYSLLVHFKKILKDTVCDFTNSFRNLNKISLNGIDKCYAKLIHKNISATELKTKFEECETSENGEYIPYIVYKNCVSPQHLHKLRKRKAMIKNHNDFSDKMELGGTTMDIKERGPDNMDRKIMTDVTLFEKFVAKYRGVLKLQWKKYMKDHFLDINKDDSDTLLIEMKKFNDERIELMNSVNPRYLLRNYQMNKAINDAINGDYNEIETLLDIIKKPYNDELLNGYDKPNSEQICDSFQNCDLLSCSS